MNNRQLGTQKEEAAARFLMEAGIDIIHTNFRCRIGEIDIIGKDGSTYVFVEVKYRNSSNKGYAAEAVNYSKQKKICRVSDYFRMINSLNEYTPCRFDVIAIDNDNINWIKNAFEYIPGGR